MRSKNYVQPVEISHEDGSDISPLTPSHSASTGNAISCLTAEAEPMCAPNDVKGPAGFLSTSDIATIRKQNSSELDDVPEDGEVPSIQQASDNAEENRVHSLQQNAKIASVTISEALETAQEKLLRKQSHKIIYITAFIMSMGFSIILTSVWLYLKQLNPSSSKLFYGIVVAINPFGQFLAAPLLGWWGSKIGSNRPAFLVSIFFFILGNIIYALLRLMKGSVAAYVLMLSRFIVGIGSANLAVCRSYLSASTTLAERSAAMSYVSAAQSMGFILGPAIQTALALAIPEDQYPPYHPDRKISSGTVQALPVWDLYTAAGWIAALLGLINLVLFLPCIYKEVNIAAREAQLMKLRVHNLSSKYPRPDYPAVCILLINFYFVLFVYVLLETIIVPMGKDLYAWTSEFAIKTVGIGLSIIGILACFVFFASPLLSNRMDERKVYIIFGLVPLVLAMLIHIPMGNHYPLMQNCSSSWSNETSTVEYSSLAIESTIMSVTVPLVTTMSPLARRERDVTSLFALHKQKNLNISYVSSYVIGLTRSRRAVMLEDNDDCDAVGCPISQTWCNYTPIIEIPQIIIANLFGVVGYPVAFTITNSLFSKMIGPQSPGFWMGTLTSTGSLSRLTGPIFVTWVYSNYGTRWTFGILLVVLCITVVMAGAIYKRLVPMDINKNHPENELMTEQS